MLVFWTCLNLVTEMPANTINMQDKTRGVYTLYTLSELMFNTLSTKFNHVKIKDVSGDHVIIKKHARLLPEIQQKVPAFNANRQ